MSRPAGKSRGWGDDDAVESGGAVEVRGELECRRVQDVAGARNWLAER
jgi:hypothetical protein